MNVNKIVYSTQAKILLFFKNAYYIKRNLLLLLLLLLPRGPRFPLSYYNSIMNLNTQQLSLPLVGKTNNKDIDKKFSSLAPRAHGRGQIYSPELLVPL
jgi:hypothetical protein